DSNNPMTQGIEDASQDNTSVVVTDRENPYSEVPPPPNPECLPSKEEELRIEPKIETSACVETTPPTKKIFEFHLLVVSDSS
ncbi:hypothetical protein PJP08_29220, partial [Mycobacterium kansasii]